MRRIVSTCKPISRTLIYEEFLGQAAAMLPLAARLWPIMLELFITLFKLVMLVMGWATVTA